jgi:RNA polymerase sigma-70 factor, ECF subfamily
MSGTLCVERKHGNASVEEVWDLVDRAKEGERAAFEELYRLHVDQISRYLQVRVADTHDAEDLTTQTFVKMLESIGRYNRRAVPFGAWLFRIAHNLAVDHFRATRRWRPVDEVPEPLGRHESSAEDKALDSLAQKRMLKLMDRLSGDQQKVLTLKFVLDYSNGEAATILGKSEGSVKSLQHRALDTLSVAMGAPHARAA